RVDDDLHDLSSVEAEFLAIVINDAFTPRDALQCKSQVSTPVNDEMDFRISFDESDDEHYIIICDKNLFSYKIIFVNNFKTDSKNDNKKVTPSIPSPEPAISCFDDFEFFKDFENEFPAIVYNDAQMSKSDLLTEQTLSLRHNIKSNLNDETSLSKYDEEEQNVLYFNDLFSFNVIHPNDLKSDEDNDNNEIDIIPFLEGNDKVTKTLRTGSFVMILKVKIAIWRYYANEMLFYLIMNLCLPPREQRHPFLRYQGLEYTDADIEDFEGRLARIYMREVHRVQVFDFRGLPDLMAEGLSARMLMEHRDAQGCEADPRQGDLRDYWIGISSAGDFLGTTLFYTAPEKVLEILGGLMVISLELPVIDMAELVRLQICMEVDDTWLWVPMGPERQPDAAAGASREAQDSPIVDEGGQADPTLVHAPPPPPPATARTVPQRLGRLEEEVQGLRRDVGSLCGLVERSMTDHGRFSTWMMSCMTQLMDNSGLTYQAFDRTESGSKFSTIVHKTKPSGILTTKCMRWNKREAEEKSNLKTSL
ncbi:hypothetical protein Tco_0040846, partial [Tanacetum coccineum]